jgi:hypothetical protein
LRPLLGSAVAELLSEINGLQLAPGLLAGTLGAADLRLGEDRELKDRAAVLVALLPASAGSLTELNLGCGSCAVVVIVTTLARLARAPLIALDRRAAIPIGRGPCTTRNLKHNFFFLIYFR